MVVPNIVGMGVYFAGMYHYSALMVLAVMQLFLLLFLTVQAVVVSRYLKVRLSAGAVAVKGEEYRCGISAEYRGKFPAGDIRFYIKSGYDSGYDKSMESQSGRGAQSLYAKVGTGKADFAVIPEYCGMMTVSLVQIRVYDQLFFGSVKKRITDRIQTPVFPQERILNIDRLFTESFGLWEEADHTAFGREGIGEIRQVREYREGDLRKQIHWNLSARMGSLWSREYEQEEDRRAEMFLDLAGYESASLKERDAFYEVLSALLLGLLQKLCQVKVCWYRQDRLHEIKVTDRFQCRNLLTILYRMPDEGAESVGTEQIRKAGARDRIILDMKLRIFQGDVLVGRFTGENLTEVLV